MLLSRLRSTPRFVSIASLVASAAALCVASSASAQELRFTTTQPGNVIATGNALGLAKAVASNGPGTNDSIGTFLSLEAANVDNSPANPLNPWGANTTNQWQKSGSTASIAFPNESQILYAELVWGGGYNFGDENVTASLNTPVKLGFGADAVMVTPDPASAVTVNQFVPNGGFTANYYMRSADVTAFVASHGSGMYAISGVPSVQSLTIESLNAAGWTLVVAYRYDNEPIRNMTIFVGSDDKFVDENTTVDYTVDGFCAPPSGDVTGTLAVSAIEGDANRNGDSLKIGQTAAGPFATLSGPNNPANNFFCSAINKSDGNIDTSGTYGMANHIPQNPSATAQVKGGRQGWDVTTVGVSSMQNQLFPGQKSAVIRTSTAGDSYMPVLAAFGIDVNAPKFLYDESTTTIDKSMVKPGDTLHFTAKLVNEGKAPAVGVAFTIEGLPAGLQLATFETDGMNGDITGAAVTQTKLGTGVPMGAVGVAAQRVVDIDFNVTSNLPANIVLKPVWKYEYTICTGDAPTDEEFNGKSVTVQFMDDPTMTTSSSTSTASSMTTSSTSAGGAGGAGGAATASGGAGGNGAFVGPDAFAQGNGIFCSASTASSDDWGGAVAVLGIALAAAARQRSRRRAA